jgi:putative membrane protein
LVHAGILKREADPGYHLDPEQQTQVACSEDIHEQEVLMKALLSCAAALCLVSCASAARDGNGGMAAMSADATPEAAMSFVMKAGASDLYEIQSSQLALQKAQNADVRQFAQMMIDHHTKTTQQVTAAARAAGLTPPPPQLEPEQARMIAELQPLSGAAFDRAYVRQQRMAHEMALALHSNYAERGDTPSLRQAAATAVPIVRQHLERVRAMPSS